VEKVSPPLHTTLATLVRYTTWLGVLGTVAASSMQPYFSTVNKYFRDHQLPSIAVGDLLADARRGLEMRRQRLVSSDTRLPLATRRPRHSTRRILTPRQPHLDSSCLKV
jgi:hypothetical protein